MNPCWKQLHSLGYSLIPLNGKAPFESNWNRGPKKSWKDFEAGWRPGMNAGIRLGNVLGSPSRRLAVIDVDVRSDNPEHLRQVDREIERLVPDYKQRPTTLSGRGNGSRHIFGAFDEPLKTRKLSSSHIKVKIPLKLSASDPVTPDDKARLSKKELDEGMRIRERAAWEISLLGERSQVVAPGSVHPDTKREYKASMPLQSPEKLPLFRKDILRTPEGRGENRKVSANAVDSSFGLAQLSAFNLPSKVVAQIMSGEGVEDRSAALLGVSISMLKAGMKKEQILAILSDQECFLGQTAYDHVKSNSRERAVRWLAEHTLVRAESIASGREDFDEVVSSKSFKRLSEVEERSVTWLWTDRLPINFLSMFSGDPGQGKSTLALYLAACVSSGRALPGEMSRRTPARVLIFSCEDTPEEVIKPRIASMGIANFDNIAVFPDPLSLDSLGQLRIIQMVEDFRPSLVIIDPLIAYLPNGCDMNKANEVRRTMATLSKLAREKEIAVLCIRHLNKSSSNGQKAIYAGQGSVDFTAAVRSEFIVGPSPISPDERVLVHVKANLARKAKTQVFGLKSGRVEWIGDSELTENDVLGGPVRQQSCRIASDDPRSQKQIARKALIEFLKDKDRPAKQCFSYLQDNFSISGKTVNRVVEEGLVHRYKSGAPGGDGPWLWQLVREALTKEEDVEAGLKHISNDHLDLPLPRTQGGHEEEG